MFTAILHRPQIENQATGFALQKRWQGPGPFPSARYGIAQRRAAAGATATLGAWEPIGPGNVGGRTKALAMDPANPGTIYAAAATGGIWKTTDAGQSWAPLGDALPTLAMNSLAIDPSDSKTLYAGSGEIIPGAGIFKTTDGGQTWTQLPATSGFAFVYSLAISPSRRSNIYAATDSGLWWSGDGGGSWSNALPMPGGCFSVVTRGDQAADIVFASCSPSGGNPLQYNHLENIFPNPGIYALYRSSDVPAGSWETVLSAPHMGATVLAIAPSAPDTIYALATSMDQSSPFLSALLGLYASDRGGVAGSWGQRAGTSEPDSLTANILSYRAQDAPCTYGPGGAGLHSGQGAWNLGLAVDPTDSQTVFTAGPFVSRSKDGGRSFAGVTTTSNVLSHVDHHWFGFYPGYDGSSNQTLFMTNDGGVYRTDSAATQTVTEFCSQPYISLSGGAVNRGLQIAQFYHGAVAPGGGVFLGGTQDTVTLLGSAASPGDWAPILNGDGAMSLFDPTDPNTMYYEGHGRGFSKSVDGGATSVPATSGITESPGNFPFATYFAMDPRNPQTIYIGGHQLWRSTNAAQTWSAAGPNTGWDITAIAVNPNDFGQVMYGDLTGTIYNLRGGAWSNVRPRSGYVSRIAFDPQQPATIYATYATFRPGPSDGQIYVSKDGGDSWTALGTESLPDIPVHVLLVDPDLSATLYAGTDVGLFVSLDAGITWARDSGFPNVITESLQIDRNGATKYLYAFTHGRGAWRVNLTPEAPACVYTVSPKSFTVSGNSGQLYAVNVDTAPGCAWAATANRSLPYVRVQSPSGGKGPGTVYFVVGTNYTGAERSLLLNIQDQTVNIQQGLANAQGGNFDQLTGAAVIASLPYLRAGGFSVLTNESTDPVHTCTGSTDQGSAWFGYRPSVFQRIDFQTSANGNPMVLAAYIVRGNAIGEEVACAHNYADVSVSPSVQVDLAPGNIYVFEVAGTGGGFAGNVSVMAQVLPSILIVSNTQALGGGESGQFNAVVSGTPNPAVRWSAVYGTIDAKGKYTAPITAQTLVDTITATSFADSNAVATTTVIVRGQQ